MLCSFISVSASVLEGVNNGIWCLLSLCTIMTLIVSHNYIEHGPKNRDGGLAQPCVPCYVCCAQNIPDCLVLFYLSKLPEYAFMENILYCQPKTKAPSDNESPWYDAIAVCQNKLSNNYGEGYT